MHQNATPNSEMEGQRDSLSLIFVSLYFLLVAFFIFLNSISHQVEERTNAVMGSVDAAFQGKLTQKESLSQGRDSGRDLGMLALFGKMRKVFETAVPLVEVTERQKEGLLQFVVPAGQIFNANATSLRQRHSDLLKEIVSTLRNATSRKPYEMDIVMGAGDSLPEPGESVDNISFKRLSVLSDQVLGYGLSQNLFSIGLVSTNSGTITFSFAPAQKVTSQHIRELK